MSAPSPDAPLGLIVDHQGAATRVVLSGELDIATAPRLQTVMRGIEETGHSAVVFDLTNVTFCDSSGLGAIVTIHEELAAGGGSLQLTGLSPSLRKVVEITGLSRTLHVIE